MSSKVKTFLVTYFCIVIALVLLSTDADAHPASAHPVANWHKWEGMQRRCETKGFKRPWLYGPNHTEGRSWSGYYGGLQFSATTWRSVNRKYRYANQAPKAIQIQAAERLRRARGLQPWPNCAWAWY